MTEKAPVTIGKYHRLEKLGRGNTAVVYRGYDPFANRHVALKVCSRRLEDNDTDHDSRIARRLFYNEAHTAGCLNHPNIIQILDAGEHAGQPYLVMELIEGGTTLKPLCRIDNLRPFNEVAEIIYNCARALHYSHQRGVIHRDIKPSNIMLTSDARVKIADFGIAQQISADTTQIGGLLGSPRFMSPEQIYQHRLTPATDIYSLGVVMFELLTGKPPFPADDIAPLAHAILHTEPPRVGDLRCAIPGALEEIVSCAMRKSPEERFATGRDMANAIGALYSDIEETADDVSDDAKFELVSTLDFFREFEPSEVWEVIRRCGWESYVPGQQIILEGAMDLALYIIVSGNVSVRKGEATICTLETGNCFGEMGYLSRARRTATIAADGFVSLLVLNSELMKRTSVNCRLNFSEAFIRTLIKRLTSTSESLTRTGSRRRASAPPGTAGTGFVDEGAPAH